MINDPAANQRQPTEEKLKPRKRLWFPGIQHNARPGGYIHVDQALDRLGEARYPLEWGRAIGFSKLPFQYVVQRKRFYTYALIRKKRISVKREPHGVQLAFVKEYRLIDKIYRSLREELRFALEANRIKAKKLVRTTGLVEIENPGI
jgi:hypothetical protein